MEKTYILDTCVVIWLFADRDKISKNVQELINNPSSRLIIPAICFWEIEIKMKRKKLSLPISSEELVLKYQDAGVEIHPIDQRLFIQSAQLGWEHEDPVDRIVVATAKKENAEIISADREIGLFFDKTII